MISVESDQELVQWLAKQKLDEPVDIGGESVYLKRYADGAELGAYLIRDHSQEQLIRAMQQGFSNALEFDAGLALAPDGSSLMLTQWLPNVSGWLEAAKPLEDFLNQLVNWRTSIVSPQVARVTNKTITNRNEQRLRMLFAGAN